MAQHVTLAGRRILVVEDDFLIASAMEASLEAAGAEVVGPASTLADALALVAGGSGIEAALLDVRLHGERVYPVAEALWARGLPFVFTTGYDSSAIDPRFEDVPRFEKPVDIVRIAQLLFG